MNFIWSDPNEEIMIEYNRHGVVTTSVYSKYLDEWVFFNIHKISQKHPIHEKIKDLIGFYDDDLKNYFDSQKFDEGKYDG